MKFINYDHSKKFTELKFSTHDWINTHDKKNMSILYLISASKELHDRVSPYFSETSFDFSTMEKSKESSPVIETMVDLIVALYDDEHSFNVNDLSKLDNEMLQLALNVMEYRYSPSSSPSKYETQQTYSVINEPEISETKEFYGLTNFSDFIQEKGLDFDKRKLSVYRERGLLPKPSVKVGRNYGWSKEQIENWVDKYNKDEVVTRYSVKKN